VLDACRVGGELLAERAGVLAADRTAESRLCVDP
jgi:hypothetical protein